MKIMIDRRYLRKGIRVRVTLWVLSVALLGCCAYFYGKPLSWISYAAFVVACIAALSVETYFRRTYRCPRCGSRLGKPEIEEPTREIVYVCAKCQVIWRTMAHSATEE